MTGTAVVHDADMSKRRRQEARGHMTLAAVIVSRHMIGLWCLPSGGRTVVALCALIDDAVMIKLRASEAVANYVTNVAILCGRNVRWICFRTLACRDNAVMARHAIAHNAGMIEYRRREGTGYVTDTAILSGRNVTDILVRRRAATIMTFSAIIHPAGMIEASATDESTAGNAMAHTAIFGRSWMTWRFPYGPGRNIIRAAVMTRHTIASDPRVR
jgi:hypothetical protein